MTVQKPDWQPIIEAMTHGQQGNRFDAAIITFSA